jgi:hypothetical protein
MWATRHFQKLELPSFDGLDRCGSEHPMAGYQGDRRGIAVVV